VSNSTRTSNLFAGDKGGGSKTWWVTFDPTGYKSVESKVCGLGGPTDSTAVLGVTRGEDCWIVPGSTLRAGDRQGGFEVIDLEILFLVSTPRDPVLLMVDFDTWSPVAPSLEDPFTGIGRSLASPGLLLLCATSDFRLETCPSN
jgi:hypothetical protein